MRKGFENPGQKPNNVQKSASEISRAIYSNSQKGRNFFETKYFFNFLLDVSKEEARSKVTIGTNNWDVKIYKNYLGICQPWPYESEYVYDYINGYSKVKLMYI